MKKSLLVVTMLFLISSKQILACNYYEDDSVLEKILKTGVYHKNVSGVVCSSEKTEMIPIKNGKVEGLYKWYYKTGKIWREIHYKNGRKDGLERWYHKTGKLAEERNYKNGQKDGLEKWYYKTGKLWRAINYKNGQKDGLEKTYYPSGALAEKSNFKNGKRVGLTIKYLENGKTIAEIHHSNGNPISGRCGNGRKWDNAELASWKKGLKVRCDY